MECVDTLPQHNLFEDKSPSESMIALQHPEQETGDDKTEEATLSDAEEAASRTNISESRVNDVDEESMDDTTQKDKSRVNDRDEESMDDSSQNLSFRRCKLVIMSDDEEDDAPSVSVAGGTVLDESSVGQKKMKVIESDSDSEDDSFLFNKKPDAGKPKVILLIFYTYFSANYSFFPYFKSRFRR